jgi:5,5'-dehydrodivanillate O-demethylase
MYWHPIYLARKLEIGLPVPIRVFSEDYTLYRGESGKPYLVAQRCAHRRLVLNVGTVEGDTIRCRFHGWRYEGSGQCVEQPAEVASFCQKVKIAAYPTQEHMGLIFVYLGEGEPPPLPRWPELEEAAESSMGVYSSLEMMPCNYFQHLENVLDETHLQYTHRGHPLNDERNVPAIVAEETNHGLVALVTHSNGNLRTSYVMPSSIYVSFLAPPFSEMLRTVEEGSEVVVKSLFYYVPIDDVSHLHFEVTLWPKHWPPLEYVDTTASPPHEEIAAILAGRKRFENLIHPNRARIEDGVSIVGQGAIADRSLERLGRSDVAVILLRKIWLRELRLLAEGEPLTRFGRPQPEVLQEHEDYLRSTATVLK